MTVLNRLRAERDTLARQIADLAASREAVPGEVLDDYLATQRRLTALLHGSEGK